MKETGNFGQIVDRDSGTNIIEIWSAKDEIDQILGVVDSRERFSVSVMLEAMRLDVYLPSFSKAPFPEIYPEMSAAEKNVELMKTEQRAPKTGLAFDRGVNNQWFYLSEIVLQNRGRRTQIPVVQPYLTTGEVKVLNRNSELGVQVIDYGNGVIGSGDIESFRPFDKVQIEGDWTIEIKEIDIRKRSKVTEQKTITVNGLAKLLNENIYRASWEIQNQSPDASLYFRFGNVNGGFLLQPLASAYSQPICEVEELWVESTKMIREIHKVLDTREVLNAGLKVPNRLIATQAKGSQSLKTYLDILGFQVRMADHLGIHPVSIEIRDTNKRID